MKEQQRAGIKGYVSAVLLALAILLGYDFIDTAFRMWGRNFTGREMILTVLAAAVGAAAVYLVITRYAAVYTYEMNQKSIVITRKIGHRERTIEIKNTEICGISKEKPEREVKRIYRMQKTILSNGVYYILYKQGGEYYIVRISSSDKFAKAIEERIK